MVKNREEDVLNKLKSNGLDKYGSWALYDVSANKYKNNKIKKTDVTFKTFDNNQLKNKINLSAMFVGLSVGDRGLKNKAWINFHDIGETSQDYRLAYTVLETPYEGCYMTDLYKDISMNSGKDVKEYIRSLESGDAKAQRDLSTNLEKFQFEYDLIRPSVIYCLGNDVFTELKKQNMENRINLGKVELRVILSSAAQKTNLQFKTII